MGNNKLRNIIGLVAISMMLGACGGSSTNDGTDSWYGQNYSDAFFANCTKPTTGSFNRSVLGVAEASATLQLDILDQPNGTIQAIGTFSIPSVERLDGFNNPWQSYFQQYASTYDPTANPNFTGTNTGYNVCVSSVGAAGALSDDAQQDITLTLRGPGGLYIEMGSSSGYSTPYIQNNYLMGQVYLGLPGHPKDSLTFTRP